MKKIIFFYRQQWKFFSSLARYCRYFLPLAAGAWKKRPKKRRPRNNLTIFNEIHSS
jgi:hypothetical protein